MSMRRRLIKARSHESIRLAKPSTALVALIYLAITYALSALETKLAGTTELLQAMVPDTITGYYGMLGGDSIATLHAGGGVSAFRTLLSIVVSLMSTVVGTGFTVYILHVSRRVQAVVGDLFEAFSFFFKVILLGILMGLIIFLWSLLLIVPGIIAAYRLSFAFYILIDNPEYSVSQCLRLSRDMTRGHKWELFVLDLTLIGWGILAFIPVVNLWAMPYIETVKAGFFDEIAGTRLLFDDGETYDWRSDTVELPADREEEDDDTSL